VIITTGDDVCNGKPDPEEYLKTVAKWEAAAQHCIVLEDADNGILSAKQAGCQTIGITTSFPKEKILAVGVDYVFSDF
jgi:sugar-phosphatase